MAVAIVLGGCGSTGAGRIPGTERQRILAYFGRTYLPTWLPPGYLFSRWAPEQGSADVFGHYLSIWFGDRGKLLIWTVDDPQDPETFSHGACSTHPFGQTHVVDGRRLVYNGGAVGQTAIICVSRTVAVTVWNGYSVKPTALEKVAASSTSVG